MGWARQVLLGNQLFQNLSAQGSSLLWGLPAVETFILSGSPTLSRKASTDDKMEVGVSNLFEIFRAATCEVLWLSEWLAGVVWILSTTVG